MNIYDFDKTIYDGDSSIDFFLFAMKKNKIIIFQLPIIAFYMLIYKLKIIKKEKLKSKFFKFITYIEVDKTLKEFWKINKNKIKEFYLKNHKDTDIITTASPEFLIKPISELYGFKLIGTKINLYTGKIIGKNCHGEEKVKRLNELGIYECEEFYSDSYSDEPLARIAKHAYLVKKNTISNWKFKK